MRGLEREAKLVRSRMGKMIGNKEKMRKMRGELLYSLTVLELWIVFRVHCTSCAGFGMSPQHTHQSPGPKYISTWQRRERKGLRHKSKDWPQCMTPWRYWNRRMCV